MRVLVLGAGGPAGVNACRALQHAGHEVIAADQNERHLGWCVGEPLLMPEVTTWAVEKVKADVVFAQPDSLVLWLAENELDAKTFQPDLETVRICQHKPTAAQRWFEAGLRGRAPVDVSPDSPLDDLVGLPFWLRATRGAGGRGAILVRDYSSAEHWMRFWASRGDDTEWVAEEYLPGRDLAWTGIWKHGELVTSFVRERVEYLYPHLTPEGITGTPTIACVIHDQAVNWIAEAAVRAVSEVSHGIMSVDLREDENGVPRPTEINAGRGFTTLGLWSMYRLNFLAIAVKCAVGLPTPNLSRTDALPEGLTLSRHIDCGSSFQLPVRELACA